MQISALLAALLCSLACLGQSSPASDPNIPAVTLYTRFQTLPDDIVIASLRAELAGIFAPSGVRFDWRDLGDPRASELVDALVVVNFEGDCSVDAPVPFGKADAGPLGWTRVSNGDVLPFSDIDCGRIHGLLGRGLRYFEGRQKSHILGLAMARVLAHELYHVIANTTKHGKGGVAQAYYTTLELLSESFEFNGHDFRLIPKRPSTPAGRGRRRLSRRP